MISKIGLNDHRFYVGFGAAILAWYLMNYMKARRSGA